jgi:hypothetical protein
MAQVNNISERIDKEILVKFRQLESEYQTKGKIDWNTAQITQQRAAELSCEFLPKDIRKYFRSIFNLHPD